MCRRPRGPAFTVWSSPPLKVPSLSPVAAQLQGFTITTRWDSLCLPAPPPKSGLWSVWCVVSPPGVCMLYTIYTGGLTHKLTPSISTGRGKGTETNLLKWQRSGVTSFKNTVGYVTLYHYNSPLKALPMHLAYVWTWNWIPSCGDFNSHRSEKAQAEAHCTGKIKKNKKCTYRWNTNTSMYIHPSRNMKHVS